MASQILEGNKRIANRKISQRTHNSMGQIISETDKSGAEFSDLTLEYEGKVACRCNLSNCLFLTDVIFSARQLKWSSVS
jgi:hypothetical protein